MRLTKYEPTDESMFPYKLKDEELSTELDSVHKLGQAEDILEKHNISSLSDLDSRLATLEIIKEKGLDILEFRHAFSLYEYNACKGVGCEELTPEEYGLLKKVLK